MVDVLHKTFSFSGLALALVILTVLHPAEGFSFSRARTVQAMHVLACAGEAVVVNWGQDVQAAGFSPNNALLTDSITFTGHASAFRGYYLGITILHVSGFGNVIYTWGQQGASGRTIVDVTTVNGCPNDPWVSAEEQNQVNSGGTQARSSHLPSITLDN